MLAYCDYIADAIKRTFRFNTEGYIKDATRVFSDLHPEKGYMISTKKVLFVKDFAGKIYRISVEELPENERHLYLK
jgi:hypothetical protein